MFIFRRCSKTKSELDCGFMEQTFRFPDLHSAFQACIYLFHIYSYKFLYIINFITIYSLFNYQHLQNFLDTAENVSLTVMLFVNQSQQSELESESSVKSIIHNLKKLYPHFPMHVVELKSGFNRGLALQKAASTFAADDLLFFVDVDVYVARDVMRRVRLNTVYNNQVSDFSYMLMFYFIEFFSQGKALNFNI